jgi:hypothetical protein
MLDKVIGLLSAEAIEKRIAAAIVLGELKVKSPEAVEALLASLASEIPLLQKHALDALGQARPAKALVHLFPLLLAPSSDVRHAAHQAIVAYGEDALPTVKGQLAKANAEERRALDGVLAELGGKGAFATLLASLAAQDEEDAKRAAVAVRAQIKGADGRERRTYLAETERFIAKLREKKGERNVPAIVGALKILGYLEDERAVPTLLACATEKGAAASVRQEAFIAIRFCMTGKRADKKLVEALIAATESEDRALAQTALLTLASLDVSDDAVHRLAKLALHPDPTRAMLVLEQLAKRGGKEVAEVLLQVLLGNDRTRVELASKGLAQNPDAAAPLAKSLLQLENNDKAWLVRTALRPHAKKLTPALRKELMDLVEARLGGEGRGYEAALDIVREADAKLLEARLRALYEKLERGKKDERALATQRLIVKLEGATDDDRYVLCSRELRQHKFDTGQAARASDEALRLLIDLVRRNFDVVRALKKDRKLDADALYYVGFHFVEAKTSGIGAIATAGEELLREVITRSGRAKLGKMAKNKLRTAGFEV